METSFTVTLIFTILPDNVSVAFTIGVPPFIPVMIIIEPFIVASAMLTSLLETMKEPSPDVMVIVELLPLSKTISFTPNDINHCYHVNNIHYAVIVHVALQTSTTNGNLFGNNI